MASGKQDALPATLMKEKISSLTFKINQTLLLRSLFLGVTYGFYLAFAIIFFYGLYGLLTNQFSFQFTYTGFREKVYFLPLFLSSLGFMVAIILSAVYGIFQFKTPYEASILADQQMKLKDRLGTATYLLEKEISMDPEIKNFVIQDSAQYAQNLEISKIKVSPSLRILPFFSSFSLFFIGLLALAFLEPLERPEPLPSPVEQAIQMLAKEGKNLEKEAIQKKIPEGKKIGEILKKASKKLKEKKLSSTSVIRKAKKKLWELKKNWEKKAFQEALKKAIQLLKLSKHTQKIAKSLEQKNFDKALKEAKKLRKEVEKQPEKFKKDSKEKKNLVQGSRKSGKLLKPTRLKNLGKELEKIAKALNPTQKIPSSKALKNMKGLKNLKERQKMLAKAMKALKNAEKLIQGKNLAKGQTKLPVYKGPLPKGTAKLAKGGKMGKQKPMPPIQPGPMKKGGKGGQQGEAKIWTGPCEYSCPYSGQCIKCPCRGKRKGICPYTKKRCKCKYCQASQGGGGSCSGGSPSLAKKSGLGKGRGGLRAGKGAAGLGLKKATRNPNRGRKTRVRGRALKDGKSMVMAIKAYKHKEESSVDYKKVWSLGKSAAEDALRKTSLPLHLRKLIQDYFDSIKPKE